MSKQMAFQWGPIHVAAAAERLAKFIQIPGVRANFKEALEKFQVDPKTQRDHVLILSLQSMSEKTGRGLVDIRKVIVWKTDDPDMVDFEIEYFRGKR